MRDGLLTRLLVARAEALMARTSAMPLLPGLRALDARDVLDVLTPA